MLRHVVTGASDSQPPWQLESQGHFNASGEAAPVNLHPSTMSNLRGSLVVLPFLDKRRVRDAAREFFRRRFPMLAGRGQMARPMEGASDSQPPWQLESQGHFNASGEAAPVW
jgi:hypothetical protein